MYKYLTLFYLVTSRKPREDEKDGQAYKFVSRSEMEADIKAGKYLEHGEYEGNLYGTKIDSILEVVQTGRTCILDVNPQVSNIASKTVFKILFPGEFLLCVSRGLVLFVLSELEDRLLFPSYFLVVENLVMHPSLVK